MSEQEQVAIRAHYEKFPATVKGAFVLRGNDRDPHQVAIREGRLVEVRDHGVRPIGLAPAVIDVAPHRDFFVPFEFAISELDAGWYRLECDVEIDGSPSVVRPGKPFSIPWPRATTRRGSVAIGRAVAPERGPKVQLDQLDMVSDAVRVLFSAEELVDLRVLADGDHLPSLVEEFDERTGKGKLTTYPVLRTHERVRIEVRPAGHPRSPAAEVEVELP